MADDFGMGYALGADSGGNNNGNGMFNGDAFWGIILLALLFGNNGFGGGFGGFGGGFAGQALTRAELYDGFAIQNIDSAVRGVQNGISDSTYALNNAITGGFNGVNSSICNLGYNIQSSINGISREIGDCCCATQRAIDGVNYNMATQFCNLGNTIQSGLRDVMDNQNANYRGLMDFLVTEKLAAKDARIAALEGQLGRSEQNGLIGARIDAAVAEILRRTGNDCPTAAYIVQPPTPVNFPTNGCGQVQFGYGGNGCGCGC